LHASYRTYVAGLDLAEVETALRIGPRDYQMSFGFRTTGMAGFFFAGHQIATVNGAWRGDRAVPQRYAGQGSWRSGERIAVIDYDQGQPRVSQLVPPADQDHEPVPEADQTNTIDSLSALMQLIRAVGDTGRCDTAVRTFDGRVAAAIEAHTVGEETLQPTSRSAFAGTALRCDFTARVVAGFRRDGDPARDRHPLHGSAWLAPVVAGGPPLPVRISFETRWFGDATMYLTAAGPGEDGRPAGGD
jgi:hypothetical protein